MTRAQAISAIVNTAADAMLHALPHPVIMVSPDGKIADANVAAEQFLMHQRRCCADTRYASWCHLVRLCSRWLTR